MLNNIRSHMKYDSTARNLW